MMVAVFSASALAAAPRFPLPFLLLLLAAAAAMAAKSSSSSACAYHHVSSSRSPPQQRRRSPSRLPSLSPLAPPPTAASTLRAAATAASSSSLSEDVDDEPKMTLYGHPGTRSPLINWAFHELGVANRVKMGDLSRNPHPFGQIPCLTDEPESGESVFVFESGAILQYVNQKFNNNAKEEEKQSGLNERQMGAVASWIAWANASLDPICFLETPEGKVYDTGLRQNNRRIGRLNEILSEREYLVEGAGAEAGAKSSSSSSIFTLADVAVASYLLYVVQFFPDVVDGDFARRWPALVRYMADCAGRPGYGKAFGGQVQKNLVEALSSAAADVDASSSSSSSSNDKKLFGLF